MDQWHEEEILITVRAYPEPSRKYRETSCVAGVVLSTVQPVRLFPIPARMLDDAQQFKKYSIIRARIRKAPKDPRPESYNIDCDSISFVNHVGTKDKWEKRNHLVEPFRVANSVEELQRRFENEGIKGAPSLALIRPQEIHRLIISPKGRNDWTEQEHTKLQQLGLFNKNEGNPLEFIPFRFAYEFTCPEEGPETIHTFSILDWEVNQAYRKWRRSYGASGWEEKFRQKFEQEFLQKKDLQFFIGTISKRPKTWTIIGLYYPPHA